MTKEWHAQLCWKFSIFFHQTLSLWTKTLNPLCFLFILSCFSASMASWGLKYFASWQYLLDFLELNNSSSPPSPPLFFWTEPYSFWFISSLTSLHFLFINTAFFFFSLMMSHHHSFHYFLSHSFSWFLTEVFKTCSRMSGDTYYLWSDTLECCLAREKTTKEPFLLQQLVTEMHKFWHFFSLSSVCAHLRNCC